MGPVAQWLEPTAHNGLVAGSSPAGPTIQIQGLTTISPVAELSWPTVESCGDRAAEGIVPARSRSPLRKISRLPAAAGRRAARRPPIPGRGPRRACNPPDDIG